MLVSFVLAVEGVEAQKRVYCGVVLKVFFTLGQLVVAGLAYWLRDWRVVLKIASVPASLLVLVWPFLPESVRSVVR